ncbi:MAG: hypothetical protein PHV67_03195, partial [Petrimonas sp.]|nr:hypothetical protein [Petrimonas sp.]
MLIPLFIFYSLFVAPVSGENYDFSNASVIVSENIAPVFRETIVDILREETYRLARIHLPQGKEWTGTNIALSLAADASLYGEPFPEG